MVNKKLESILDESCKGYEAEGFGDYGDVGGLVEVLGRSKTFERVDFLLETFGKMEHMNNAGKFDGRPAEKIRGFLEKRVEDYYAKGFDNLEDCRVLWPLQCCQKEVERSLHLDQTLRSIMYADRKSFGGQAGSRVRAKKSGARPAGKK